MAVQLTSTQVIDRPVATVFRFMVDEHVRNHPRWDPDIALEQETDGPLGMGTVIRRQNSRSGTPVEGTMEVVEYERDRVVGMVIHDGGAVMHARTTFEPAGEGRTRVTTNVDIPGMDASTDTDLTNRHLERSARVRKELIESET